MVSIGGLHRGDQNLPMQLPLAGWHNSRLAGGGMKGDQMNQDAAEVFALQVLGWLVANDALRAVFLGATGANETDLRAQAAEPAF